MTEQSRRASRIGFRGETLWDWLELLIVPAVLGAGALWFAQVADDRAKNLKAVLIDHNKQNRHGNVSTLSEAEIEALIEFLKGL